jgi:hypothetical protein
VKTELDIGDRSEWIRVERDMTLCELYNRDTFCKIVQLSSRMLLSVIFAIINLCAYLGGRSLYKFKKQNSIILNY